MQARGAVTRVGGNSVRLAKSSIQQFYLILKMERSLIAANKQRWGNYVQISLWKYANPFRDLLKTCLPVYWNILSSSSLILNLFGRNISIENFLHNFLEKTPGLNIIKYRKIRVLKQVSIININTTAIDCLWIVTLHMLHTVTLHTSAAMLYPRSFY